jgi:hypothetical protein
MEIYIVILKFWLIKGPEHFKIVSYVRNEEKKEEKEEENKEERKDKKSTWIEDLGN